MKPIGSIHLWFKSPWKGWSGFHCHRCGCYTFTHGRLRAIIRAALHPFRCRKPTFYITEELLNDTPPDLT